MSVPPTNPDDPYQYLSPGIAMQYEVLSYVSFTVLGVWMWDSIIFIHQDWGVIHKASAHKRISLPVAAYYISRLTTLTFMILIILFYAAPIKHCHSLLIATNICGSVASSSSAFLFLPRTAAIFHNSRLVVTFLSVLWLVLFATSTFPIFALSASTIGTTSRCIITDIKPYGVPSIQTISLAVFDTMVFFLTSYRLISQTTLWNETKCSNLVSHYLQVFCTARGLSHLSKALLRGNQKYYLTSVGLSVFSHILVFAPKVPEGFRFVLVVPVIAVQNMLACRIFCQTLLDVTSVQAQRIELENQSPVQIRHDIVFAEALGEFGFGDGLEDANGSSQKRGSDKAKA
ncbi:hypothetical protein C8Q75DRAFT_161165 [Abortiporus biennis]|nr:hypothetical protein C8Q75DRAFT_161165 [Abortiporus biennis]